MTTEPPGSRELAARVRALSAEERSWGLYWLAAAGPRTPDGEALTRMLAALDARNLADQALLDEDEPAPPDPTALDAADRTGPSASASSDPARPEDTPGGAS